MISLRSARVKERGHHILTIENERVFSHALFSSNFSALSYHVFVVCRALWGEALLVWCPVTSVNYYYINVFIIHDSHHILQRVITFPAVKWLWAELNDLTSPSEWAGTESNRAGFPDLTWWTNAELKINRPWESWIPVLCSKHLIFIMQPNGIITFYIATVWDKALFCCKWNGISILSRSSLNTMLISSGARAHFIKRSDWK